MRYITWEEVMEGLKHIDDPNNTVYGVPKGGMIAAGFLKRAKRTYRPEEANIILDDLIDSGATKTLYESRFPNADFVALINKDVQEWLVFPWEADHPCGEEAIEDTIIRQLQYLGEDVTREGLKETPKRVVKSWKELFAGYSIDPASLVKTFTEEKTQIGGLVYLRGIEFYSTCEHHMLPFSGLALVAYIPNGAVIGASKLARILDVYARRLQIQERIGEQVVDLLMEHLKPLGAACLTEAKHFCMACRGVNKQHSVMGYHALRGCFLEHSEEGIAARAELMTIWNRDGAR